MQLTVTRRGHRVRALAYGLLIALTAVTVVLFNLQQAAPVLAGPETGLVPEVQTTFSCDTVTEIPQTECEALVALYESTDGVNWSNNDGWLQTTTPCSWYGIDCLSGSVYKIDVPGNNLSGSLPAQLGNLSSLEFLYLYNNQLTGSIPAELGNLSNLRYLYLHHNQLTGAIPPELGNLSSLQGLSLSNNQLGGTVPAELGNLSSLRILILHHNQFTGTIPPELGNLSSLQTLNLTNNQLTGVIPAELGNLTSLQSLSLYSNQLTGAIPPELGSLSNLQTLYLNNNQLTGPIPSELGNVSNLEFLFLYNNQLTGAIRPELGNLSSLQYLQLDNNQLTGAIPPELGNLSNLRFLTLFNNQLVGAIPSQLGNLSNLTYLRLEQNALSGEVPPSITNLTNLNLIAYPDSPDLGYNALLASDPTVRAFLDQIDPDWATTQTVAPADVQVSEVGDTNAVLAWTPISYTADGGYYEISYALSSSGPFTVDGVTDDKLASNYTVTGLDPETTYYFRLRTFTPAHGSQQNALWSGYSDMVSAMTTAAAPALSIRKVGPAIAAPASPITYTLIVSNSGSLAATNLVITDVLPAGAVYIRGGSLSGDTIQWEAASLHAGTRVSTSFTVSATTTITNSLYGVSAEGGYAASGNVDVVTRVGELCAEVTEIPQIECEALVALYVSTDGSHWSNNDGWLQTTTPCSWYGIDCLSGSVYKIDLPGNSLSGSLPAQLGNLSNLHTLSLHTNQLTGAIPPELGHLSSLEFLHLSNNLMTGAIPPELGNLSSLQKLYLTFNQLTGGIPAELGNLSHLQELWLSYNQLTGVIPPELGNLSSLQELRLDHNQLTGTIPPELGSLSSLEWLDLTFTQLTGAIPPELGNLSSLQSLYLHNNQLTGAIPPELGNLSNLQRVWLNNNQLTGAIPPELHNLSNLQYLSLFSNQLTGAIPPEFGNLSNLTYLRLEQNALSGEVPPSITNLVNLATYSDAPDFGYNALVASDPAVHAFLDQKDPDWAETQTVAPSDVQVSQLTTTSVLLTWTPISYTGDGGTYEISYALASSGPFTVDGVTADKLASSYTVTGLDPETTYYFRLRTFTPAHGDQQNALWSGYSALVSATTIPSSAEQATVTPETGGTLVYTDTAGSSATVQVPGGAVTETIQLVYQPLTDVQPGPSSWLFAGQAFTLEAYQNGALVPDFAFARPVTITLVYTDGAVASIDEETLSLQYWDGSQWTGADIILVERRPLQNEIVVAIKHLSRFALFGQAETQGNYLYLPIIRRE